MYYLVYFYGILVSFNNKKNRFLFLSFFLMLIILAMFRFGVGSDYFSYSYLFQRLNSEPFSEINNGLDNQEVLFRFLGSFLKSIGLSYQQYLSLFALIGLYFTAKTCWEYSSKPILSLLIYYSFFYFVWTFSGIRQGITLSVGMYYFLRFNEEDRKRRFILIVLFLSFIHSSVLILIPLFYIVNTTLQVPKNSAFA